MNVKYFALGLLACAGMVSCSNNDDLVNDEGKKTDGSTEVAYLAVNINNVGGPLSRAGEEFEDGTADESKVTKARFYFFDGSGSAADVFTDGQTSVNFQDVSSDKLGMTNSGTTTDNVTSISNAVLVLNNVKTAPASMVVVVNPSENLGKVSKSLSDLKAESENYASASLTTGGAFVMSNSVYADGTSTVCEVPVTNYIKYTQEAAMNAPVQVYVERAVAKVSVTFTGAEDQTNNRYLVSDESAEDKVYAQIVGWNVVGATDAGNLLKQIDPTNWNTGLSWTGWNDASNFRSYWATSTGTVSNAFKYNDLTNKPNAFVYTQEHTSTSAISDLVDNDLTKIVVAAKLVDENGNAKTLYRYLGSDYVNANDILTLVANEFASTYYTKSGETYASLAATDLELKTGTQLSQGASNSYKVYPQVKEGVTLYVKNTEGGYDPLDDNSAINNTLKGYYAEAWTEGMCYYTTTIQHLAESGVAKYGVVRNHVYNVRITDVTGFGTPVYNGDEEIERPVVPSDDYSYLSAQINVLAWKVVSNDVTLGGSTTVGQ